MSHIKQSTTVISVKYRLYYTKKVKNGYEVKFNRSRGGIIRLVRRTNTNKIKKSPEHKIHRNGIFRNINY